MKFADQVADLLQGNDNIVTKYMYDWDGVMTPEAIRKVAELEVRDNSQEGQEAKASGQGRIRPSNLGERCARLHALSWLGYPKIIGDDSLMKDGIQRHYFWQKVGLSAGFLTDIEVKVRVPNLEIYGSMDGALVDGTVFEFKTTGPTLYDQHIANRAPAFEHLLQVHAYMAATDTKKASIVYEKRSYKVEWREFRVEWDSGVWNTLLERISPVIDAIDQRELPPMLEECLDHSGYVFDRCRFHEVCPSAKFEWHDQ